MPGFDRTLSLECGFLLKSGNPLFRSARSTNKSRTQSKKVNKKKERKPQQLGHPKIKLPEEKIIKIILVLARFVIFARRRYSLSLFFY
jgi:hypothetical protein